MRTGVAAFALRAVALSLVVTAALVAATPERASSWRDRDVAVDGQDGEWQGLTLPVKGEHFSLGLVNDGEYLYVCLPTRDLATRTRIARNGLIVWLDRAGGKKNRFGVHFPIAVTSDPRRPPAPPSDREREPRDEQPVDEDPIGGQQFVAIRGPGSRDAEVVPLPQAGGIEARVGVHDGLLVYELRVPLKRDGQHPYAPDVKPGDRLRVQLETPSVPGGRAPLGRLPGGVVVVGGGRGIGVGGGVAIGGGGPFGSTDMLRPLDVTFNLRLAAGPI